VNRKADFLQNESIRIDSRNESNRIDSNRELECSRHWSGVDAAAAVVSLMSDPGIGGGGWSLRSLTFLFRPRPPFPVLSSVSCREEAPLNQSPFAKRFLYNLSQTQNVASDCHNN